VQTDFNPRGSHNTQLHHDVVARASRSDYRGWLAHVMPAAACSRPVRLKLEATWHDERGGESERVTDDMPDGTLYVACKNRRASVCPACAETYRADTYQLVKAGLMGGKGVPETVTHPCFFVTLTAPAFGQSWIKERKVSQRSREEHASIWANHVEPFLGRFRVNEIGPEVIRRCRAGLLDTGRSEDRTAKAYRLVRSMFATAVDDGRIKRNPCRIKGADQHRTPERPHASIDEVYRLAEVVPKRYRFLVLLAAFSGLRWGELIALQRRDVDRKTMVVRVSRRIAQMRDGEMSIGPTKSAAGVRTVALPKFLVEDLADPPGRVRRVRARWPAVRRQARGHPATGQLPP
jgi:hypothetical protein